MRSPNGRRESKAGGSFVSGGVLAPASATVPGAIAPAAQAVAPVLTKVRREIRMSSSKEAIALVKVRDFYYIRCVAAAGQRELLQIARPGETEDEIGIEMRELAGSGTCIRTRKIYRLHPDIRNAILSDHVSKPAIIRGPI